MTARIDENHDQHEDAPEKQRRAHRLPVFERGRFPRERDEVLELDERAARSRYTLSSAAGWFIGPMPLSASTRPICRYGLRFARFERVDLLFDPRLLALARANLAGEPRRPRPRTAPALP